jgi:hypothetical protein
MFRIKKAPGASSPLEGMPPSMMPDTTEVYFTEDGLIVRNILFSQGSQIARTDITYVNKNGIFVIQSMATSSSMAGYSITSIIEYTSILVNVDISDKEFEL